MEKRTVFGSLDGAQWSRSQMPTRISTITFNHFKAFSRFSLRLDHVNVLVGPNNSGKSTIVGVLRVLDSGLKIAKSRPPEVITINSERNVGYQIPADSLPISLENVHTDYADVDSKVTFTLSNRNKLHLLFPKEGGCLLLADTQEQYIGTAASFKKAFPVSLTVVPVLGPVEHEEILREKSTVVRGLATHRASRHFRSYWHHFKEGFERFALLVKTTWPGMEINAPEIANKIKGELSMFCLEDRMTRELYWVGFGFQIWCQLLTHLSRAKGTTIIVIDEPEVYLHPDIQRQLLGIIRDIGPDVVLATHSTEIMSEADPGEIVIVDKSRRSGERLKDVVGVQRALDAVGSVQNITLTYLARNRRVLFVEGEEDFQLLRRFARKIGMSELAAGIGITPLRSGGFGSWKRIRELAGGISEALGTKLAIGAIYDRDYFCDEEIEQVGKELLETLSLVHIHLKKEIENYLLVPSVLDRAIEKAIEDRAVRTRVAVKKAKPSEKIILEIAESLKEDIQAQIVARRADYIRTTQKKGRDLAEIARETMTMFARKWRNTETRMALLPGKEVLRTFRERMQIEHGISLSSARIVEAMGKEDVSDEMKELLVEIEKYRKKEIA